MAAGKCKAAYYTDEWHGYGCSITDGACMFLFPDSNACAEKYGEGPDAGEDEGMEIIRMSDLSIDDIEMVKKHIMRLYNHDDYEEWNEIGIIVGKDHPAFSEVEKISERSKKE